VLFQVRSTLCGHDRALPALALPWPASGGPRVDGCFEIGTRRMLHWNTPEHPTVEWTTQQLRNCATGEEPYRFVIHDRDTTSSPAVDHALQLMNLLVLKTPSGVPQANTLRERLIGTVGRECLDHAVYGR
jgi:hypothetical protein